MDSLALANKIADIALDKQASDILILDLTDITTITDYFVICSGDNRRQLHALESSIQEEMKKGEERILPLSSEGTPESGWILLDYNSVIVHLFSEDMRDYYELEELWDAGRVVARIQ